MTIPDKPARPAASESVSSLVGEFMEEKRREQADETAREKGRRRKNPAAVASLFLLCAAVWIAPSMMIPPAPEPTAEELERGARLSLYLTALQIRQFQDSTRRLPASLTEAGAATPNVDYTPGAGAAYELSTRVEGTLLVYKSSLPDSVFLGNLRVRGVS